MSETTETPPSEEPTPPTPETPPTTLVNESPTTEPVIEHVPLTNENITLPEGFQLDETLSGEFLGVANELKLNANQANKLVELHAKVQKQALEADSAAWNSTQEEWKTAATAEFGDKLQPTLANIGKLIDEYGSKEFRDAMDLTGAGNNPHFIKFLSNIAEKLTEPTPSFGSPKPSGDMTAAQRMFPSMKG